MRMGFSEAKQKKLLDAYAEELCARRKNDFGLPKEAA